MAKENDAIVTKKEVALITGLVGAGWLEDTECCTKTEAIELEADPKYLKKYLSNLLVKYLDIKDATPAPPTYYYYEFTFTFFFLPNKALGIVTNGLTFTNTYITEGIGGIDEGGYITVDSDTYINYNHKLDNISAVTTYSTAIPLNIFNISSTGMKQHLTGRIKSTNRYNNLIVYTAGSGFTIYTDDKKVQQFPSSDYVYYIANDTTFGINNFSDVDYIKISSDTSIEGSSSASEPYTYHIWAFANEFLANYLLGNDSYSYE